MTKQELCEKAESSGLLKPNVSMYPQATATARPGQSASWFSLCALLLHPQPTMTLHLRTGRHVPCRRWCCSCLDSIGPASVCCRHCAISLHVTLPRSAFPLCAATASMVTACRHRNPVRLALMTSTARIAQANARI